MFWKREKTDPGCASEPVSATVVEPELEETLVPPAKAVSFIDEDVVREWLTVSKAIGAMLILEQETGLEPVTSSLGM
jgi:hypothetical protein